MNICYNIITNITPLRFRVFGLSRIYVMFEDTKSAVSLAGVYESPTKSALTGV